MARPALATVDDLERLLGESVPDTAQALARLEQASEIVRAYANETWLDDAGALADDVPEQLAGVVSGIVERATRNPGGVTQEQAGPFSRSFGSDAAQRLFLTKWDKAVIRAALGLSHGNIGTLTTTRGDLETANAFPDRYLATEDDEGNPWPW